MGVALKSGLKIIGGIMNNTVLGFECVGMDNGGKFPIEYTGQTVRKPDLTQMTWIDAS